MKTTTTTLLIVALWTTMLDIGYGFQISPSSSSEITSLIVSSRTTTTTTTTTQLDMSSTLSSNNNKKNTPPPKYPTRRGETVDSRKIVVSHRQHLEAMRLNHILFATEPLATSTLVLLRKASLNFPELASQISNCEETRDHAGSIGWVSMEENFSTNPEKKDDEVGINDHLDGILPPQARQSVLYMNTKPGDIVMVESERGFHLVQIADVMVNVQKMATTHKKGRRRNSEFNRDSDLLHLWDKGKESSSPTKLNLTYRMETMGCQMNQADSERMEGQLQSLGIQPEEQEEPEIHTGEEGESNKKKRKKKKKKKEPNVVLLNTCSIRDKAEQKVYSHLGPHAKRKREGEDVTIIVAGCVAQQEGEALLQKFPEIDLVMGPQYANRMADLLEDVVVNGNQVVATDATHIMEDSTKPRRSSDVAAWVNVIYGCNDRCTYCIVPTTRGVEQSRPVESIITEVEDLVAQGYKEVTLLGQNIDAYGRDMVPKRRFSDLIHTIGEVKGLERLRFVTSHPRYMSVSVVDAVAETPAACHAFHVPFQSGSNEILQQMGRGHTREKYLRIMKRIKDRIPEASITADVIVGFPGETEEQFQDTLDLMKEVVFDSVNTAAYSPRPNTPAATYGNQLPHAIKKDRLKRINILNKQHAAQRRARMLGRDVEILVEERNHKTPLAQVMGRTTQGYLVYCPGKIEELKGKLVTVRIDACQTYYLAGLMVDDDGQVIDCVEEEENEPTPKSVLAP